MSDAKSDARTLELIEELRAVVADAEAALSGRADPVAEGRGADSVPEGQGADAVADGNAGLAELRSDARARAETLAERAEALGEDLTSYVHEHPWESVSIAAGVGLVLGVLLARR
jgi:ElaB/YqjD/DUF883 family membrane-anchored ribosome-binding protein